MNRFQITLACTCALVAAVLAAALIRPEKGGHKVAAIKQEGPRTRPSPAADRHTRSDFASIQIRARQAAFSVGSADSSDHETAKRLSDSAVERLSTLHRDLDLNATQQQRIFAVLVAFSAPDHSAIQIGGQLVSKPEIPLEDAILAELDAGRAQIYQELLLDDSAWWESAIVQLEQSETGRTDTQAAPSADP